MTTEYEEVEAAFIAGFKASLISVTEVLRADIPELPPYPYDETDVLRAKDLFHTYLKEKDDGS